jgi:large subunit ribosomal protein L13
MLKIKRDYWLINADSQVVGRIATKAANLLIGKHKPEYVPYLDVGDYVIIINAKKAIFTGNKETEKVYYRHSRYPGGLKKETPRELREKGKSVEILKRAIKGMLPKNSLAKKRLKRLKIFEDNPKLPNNLPLKEI